MSDQTGQSGVIDTVQAKLTEAVDALQAQVDAVRDKLSQVDFTGLQDAANKIKAAVSEAVTEVKDAISGIGGPPATPPA
jgi:hypothetical protein